MPRVGERPGADGKAGRARPGRHTGLGVGVGGAELLAIAPVAETGQHDLARLAATRRHVPQRAAGEFESTQALERIAPPGAVVDLVPHGLAEFAVARNFDAEVLLLPHNVDHRPAQLCLESLLVAGFTRGTRAVRLDQMLRTGEAAGVARQDVCATASHGSPPSGKRGAGNSS